MNAPLPQLRMRHPLTQLPATRSLPDGYTLRLAQPEDADALARCLNCGFPEMMWDVAKVREILLDHPEVPETYLIETDGVVVATASYQTMENSFPGAGWVHYVAADPEHSGKGLGYVVTARVVEEAHRRARNGVYLTTDDPRLPAIQTYLKLGFEPDSWHESHAARWAAVELQLKS